MLSPFHFSHMFHIRLAMLAVAGRPLKRQVLFGIKTGLEQFWLRVMLFVVSGHFRSTRPRPGSCLPSQPSHMSHGGCLHRHTYTWHGTCMLGELVVFLVVLIQQRGSGILK